MKIDVHPYSNKGTERGVNNKQRFIPDIRPEDNIAESVTVIESNYTAPPLSAPTAPSPARTAPPPPPLTATVTETVTVTATVAEPIPANSMEVNVHKSKTIETDPMTSVNELITSTDAMSIDSSLPTNLTQSTVEMTSMTKAVSNIEEEEVDNSAAQKRQLAFITHVDHPNRFYMQINSDTSAIEELHESLQIVAPQLPPLNDFRAGQLCIGKFSLDGCWYRAKIIDTDGDITSIQFIDYGNTDSITDNELLKAPDMSLMSHEPFAMACSLPIAPHGNTREWAENACEKLRLLSIDTPIEFELVSKYKDVNYVKIFLVGGRDLMREMIQEEVADPVEIIKTGETCYVSHINSLSEFYIQVESDTDALHKVELHLQQNCDSPILSAPSIGQICSAKFEDDQFYRARILDILPDNKHYRVEFLDYGNHFVTAEIRSLNPKIAEIPYLRKRCQLQLPNDVRDWSEEAEQQFVINTGYGATAYKVHLMKPGKTACVELYMADGSGNLSTALGEYCEKRPASPVIVDEISQDQVAITMLSDIIEEAFSHE